MPPLMATRRGRGANPAVSKWRVQNTVKLVTPKETVEERYARLKRERETAAAHDGEKAAVNPSDFAKDKKDGDKDKDTLTGSGAKVADKKIPTDNDAFNADIARAANNVAQVIDEGKRRNVQTNAVARLARKYDVSVLELDEYLTGAVDDRLPVWEKWRGKDDVAADGENAGGPKTRSKAQARADRAAKRRELDESARAVIDGLTPEQRAELERAGLGETVEDVAREALSFGGVVTGRNLADAANMYNAAITQAQADAQAAENKNEDARQITRAEIERSFADAGITPHAFISRVYASQPDLASLAIDTGIGLVPFVSTARDVATGAPAWQVGLSAAADVFPGAGAAGAAGSVARRGAARYGAGFSRRPTYRAGLEGLGFTVPVLNPRKLAQGIGDAAGANVRTARAGLDPKVVPFSAIADAESTVRIPRAAYAEYGVPSVKLRANLHNFEKRLTPEGKRWLRSRPETKKLLAGGELTAAEQRALAPPPEMFRGVAAVPKPVRDYYQEQGKNLEAEFLKEPRSLLDYVATRDTAQLGAYRAGLSPRAGAGQPAQRVQLGAADQPTVWIETDVGRAAEYGQTPVWFHGSPALELSDPLHYPDLATGEPYFGGAFVSPGAPLPRFINQAARGEIGERPGAIAFMAQPGRTFHPPTAPKVYTERGGRDVVEFEAEIPGSLYRAGGSFYERPPVGASPDPLQFGAQSVPLESRYRFFADSPHAYPKGKSGPRWPAYELMVREGTDFARTPGWRQGVSGTARNIFGEPWKMRGYRIVADGDDVSSRFSTKPPSASELDAEITRLYDTRDLVARQAGEAGGADEFALYALDNEAQSLTRYRDDLSAGAEAYRDAQATARRIGGSSYPFRISPYSTDTRAALANAPPMYPPGHFGRDDLSDPFDYAAPPRTSLRTAASGMGATGGPGFERSMGNPLDFPRTPGGGSGAGAVDFRYTPIIPLDGVDPCVENPSLPGCRGETPPVEESGRVVVPVEPSCDENPNQAKCRETTPAPVDTEKVVAPPVEPSCDENPNQAKCRETTPAPVDTEKVVAPPVEPSCDENPNQEKCKERVPPVEEERVVPPPPPPPPPPPDPPSARAMTAARPPAPPPSNPNPAPLSVTARPELAPTIRSERRLSPPARSSRPPAPPPSVVRQPPARTAGAGGRATVSPPRRAAAPPQPAAAGVARAPTPTARVRRAPRVARPPARTAPPRPRPPAPESRGQERGPRTELNPRLVDFRYGYDRHTVDLATGAHEVETGHVYSAAAPALTFRVITVSDTPAREHVVDMPGPQEFVVSGGGVGMRPDTPTAAINRVRRVRTQGMSA